MSLVKISLYAHILCGFLSLIAGAVAIYVKKRRGVHTKVGNFYFYAVTVTCISAVVLSILNWDRSSYLFFIALFSYSFLIRGYFALKKRNEGWLKRHIGGMVGSYIAMTTAFLVVSGQYIPLIKSLPPILLWFLPSIVGVPVIKSLQKATSSTGKHY